MLTYPKSLPRNESDHLVGLFNAGRYSELESRARDLVKEYPDTGLAWKILGASLLAQGKDALSALKRAAEFMPDDAEAHNNLGVALIDRGDANNAILRFRRALDIDPYYAEAHNSLGAILKVLGRLDESISSLRRALEINPEYAQAHRNLGAALQEVGRLDDAVTSYRRALEIDPDDADTHNNLGTVLKDLGRLKDAVASYHRALQIKPDYAEVHSNLLFIQNYLPEQSAEVLLADAQHFGDLAARKACLDTDWPNSPEPDRCLRVGFVSGDLRGHPVGHFLQNVLPAVSSNASGRLQLFGYPTHYLSDALTEGIKACCHGWHPAVGFSDETLARRIRDDGIDILIDLSGHTAHNRLSVFAWKPAPVQVSWLGYFATTGVAAIDYLIADHWTLPESEEAHFTEKIWRLPETRLCYSSPEAIVDVAPLPALINACITFGCFNDLTKVNDAVVALWARLLVAVPDSRLFLKAKQFNDNLERARITQRFAVRGVGADRLVLAGSSPRIEYLEAYNQVDISLDPFPYPGGATTVDSLWMGVPVLTLAGERFLSRQGVGLLMNAGLPDWIAVDADDYVARAVSHAGDLQRLALLRKNLRQQVLNSPLFDAPRFAVHFETALRGMWKEWCVRRSLASSATSMPQDEGGQLVALFDAERHAELESRARALLERCPDSGPAWKVLGASLQVQGKDTLSTLKRAAELMPDDAEVQNNLGIALQHRGQFEAALARFRRALEIEPDYAGAHRNLGVILKTLGQLDDAVTSFRRVLELKPDDVEAYSNLGAALRDSGQLDDAMESYHQALRINPDYAEAHRNLGNVLLDKGQADAAVASYRRALEINPDFAKAHSNLGGALHALGQLDDAVASYRRALDLDPDFAEAHSNMGAVLYALGQLEDAAASYRQALQIDPGYANAHNNLGIVLQSLGQLDEAVASYRRALDINSNLAKAHGNLGAALREIGQLSDAAASCRRALEIKPDYAEAHLNLGNVMKDVGRLDYAVASYSQALEIRPDYVDAHCNLIFTTNFISGQPTEVMLALARRFGDVAGQLACPYTGWPNIPELNRSLRVGFVSGDLRNHPVGHFIEGVLSDLFRNASGRLKLFAYANHSAVDELTERIKACCDVWRLVERVSDKSLARQIRDDGIDILIDLSGHTGGNRLPMFAWKPAPVQVSWLGYFATTGVAAIDYLIADPWTLPESEEVNFTEKVWRLPETRLCFTHPDADVDVKPLPALVNGHITFGCFNSLHKISDAVVALWARVLISVRGSRLFLKAKQFGEANVEARQRIMDCFAANGVDPRRLILEGFSLRAEYLAAYHRVDIALDPFPFPGGTTTVESLWMGVPVLTLAGKSFLSRQGVGLLMNAGLPEWIAADADDYVARAVSHASDLQRLASLRQDLRQQVLASPVFDAPRFARHFEAALRGMWQVWCKEQLLATESESIPEHECDQLISLFNAGEYGDVERQARAMVGRYPGSGFAWGVLGASLQVQGKDGLPMLQKAAEFQPDDAEAQNNLGVALLHAGQPDASLAACRRAVNIEPEYAEGHYNLASAEQRLGKLDEAVVSYRRALAIEPEFVKAFANLGAAYQDLGRIDEAVASFQRAIELDPSDTDAYLKLAVAQTENWQVGHAVVTCREGQRINPEDTRVFSGLICTEGYLPEVSASRQMAEACRFGNLVLRRTKAYANHGNPAEANRCLRVGFVSADFRAHPVGYFMEGFLAALKEHVSGRIAPFAYSVSSHTDDTTDRIKASCDVWRSVADLSDETLARQIREDGIDILIDLGGHTGANRLSMFAWKPAPVQASWLGYLGTTGVAAIDYLVADSWVLPEADEAHYTEQVVRLPSTYLCFSPPDVDIEVNPLRAVSNGYVTFGCFNNLAKVNDGVIELWSRVLAGVPQSRLFLKARQFRDESIRKRIIDCFAGHGIESWRLVLEGKVPSRAEHLADYHRVDISLDPFPYPGITTSLESLWMGVPVLTLAGESFLSRQGVGLLMNAGMPEWIATNPDDYVARAVRHARDLKSLASLRSGLRQQVLASPLFDAPRFALHFEAALLDMWQAWCARKAFPAKERTPMKTFLHVGCGPQHKERTTRGFNTPEWAELRLDIDEAANPDVVGSMLDMSVVVDGSMDAVFSSHNIEHLYPHEVPVALAEFLRVLKPDGFVVITCPDLQSVCQLIAEDKLTDPAYISPAGPISPLDILYGHRASLQGGNLHMAHRCGFTERVLIATLQEAGFVGIVSGSRAYPNYDLWAVATKGQMSEEEIAGLAAAHFPE